MPILRLDAAAALQAHVDANGALRIAWNTPDWLGPAHVVTQSAAISANATAAPPLRETGNGADDLGGFQSVSLRWPAAGSLQASVRAYSERPLIVLQLETGAGLDAFANHSFVQPSFAWHFSPAQRQAGGLPEGSRTYGHQYSEFALPVSGDADALGFLFAPHRPAVVEPLLFIAPDGRTLLLGPLDQFHEQIIAVPSDRDHAADGIRWGWHGDLDELPAGFRTALAIVAADGPRRALQTWADILLQRHRPQRLSRYADDLLGKLSYWTDNGAVYYYRTEPGCDYSTTLERVIVDLHQHDVPIRNLQIDSWFYPHQNLRPVSAEGAPIVPPSGMLSWEPRADLFPDGFRDLQKRAGGLPLTFHSRHFSSQSPYVDAFAAWTDGEYAHPSDAALFDLLMASAAQWGANTYEQDWLVESFLGVRGLRAAPGRARAWQEAMDRAAGEHGLHLQWCMATPADFLQTVTLRNIASIRTSGDYRYLFDNGLNWVWFLQTNALARALGLWPFKDVFLSHGKTSLSDGEPYAEVEALLSALSAGPVGIGDQLGHTNRELVMRCCREDGVLIKPDVPIAAVDRCFARNSFFEPALLIGETHSLHAAGCWFYIASFNAYQAKQPRRETLRLAELGLPGSQAAVVVYDWRRRTWQRQTAGAWEVNLDFQDWDYRVVCPLLPGEVTLFGDAGKYASVGDQRISQIVADGATLRFDVHGGPNALIEIHGYAARAPQQVLAWDTRGNRTLARQAGAVDTWSWDDGGGWTVRVHAGDLGYARVNMRLA